MAKKSESRRTESESGLQALSLFSGAGGMDIGVAKAGFKVLACVEIDPHCCETLRANIGERKDGARVVEADIREVDPRTLMKELNLKPGQLDLLFGGPPCQAFSQIGKQESLADERGMLLFQMVRFAEVFKPKALMIEQVKGLLSAKDHDGKPGKAFEMLLRDLESLGYVPKWQLINTADFGVPQTRKRVFIVATPKPNGFQFPQPTHGPEAKAGQLFPLKPYVGVGEALKGLGRPAPKNGHEVKDSHMDVTPARDTERIHGVPEGSFLAAQTHLPKEQRQNLSKKDTTKYLRLDRSRPSNTLRGGEIFFHPTQDRYLTPREYMRIHGYPDEYFLKGPIRSRSGRIGNLDQHRQVANSVPPPVAHAVATAIRRTLDCLKSLKSSGTR